jgi:hypothetical protein
MGASGTEERTYGSLLAALGEAPSVWAECLFANPIADIAVLGSPDGHELWEEAGAYEALVASTTPMAIADAPEEGRAWLLSLKQEWFGCVAQHINGGPLWTSDAEQPIVGGMSGSPILSADGKAIGICCLSAGSAAEPSSIGDDDHRGGGPNPRLLRDLPGWFLHGAGRRGRPHRADAQRRAR